jgi:hypothetical protein
LCEKTEGKRNPLMCQDKLVNRNQNEQL